MPSSADGDLSGPLHRRSRGALAALLVLGAALLPGGAEAQDQEQARAHHAAAVAYFEQGRYDEAAVEFREAHTLSGRSHVLLNVARSLELAGHHEQAADALDEYLALEPEAEDAEALQARAAELRRRASSAAPEPTPAVVPDASGDEADDHGDGSGDDGWVGPAVLLTLAGASLAGAVTTGALALDLHGSVSERCTGGVCPEDVRGDVDAGVALTLASDVLFGVTAALALSGIVWWIVEATSGGSEDAAATVSAGCVPGMCGATLRGSY